MLFAISIIVGVALVRTLMLIILMVINSRRLKKLYYQLSLLNKEVHLKNTELVAANQTKDKLFSVIAYDLKSPFNALMGILEILVSSGKDLSENDKMNLLENLYKQTITTYGTLENLLQWAMSKRKLITPSE